jgi:hypothetical protein
VRCAKILFLRSEEAYSGLHNTLPRSEEVYADLHNPLLRSEEAYAGLHNPSPRSEEVYAGLHNLLPRSKDNYSAREDAGLGRGGAADVTQAAGVNGGVAMIDFVVHPIETGGEGQRA